MTGRGTGTSARVQDLYIYPLKAAAGLRVQRVELDRFGVRLDRRWMVVDADGRFISQRERPRMARVRVALEDDALTLTAPALAPLRLPLEPETHAESRVRLWGDAEVPAVDVGDEAADWFGTLLDAPCRVVHATRESARPVDPRYDRGGAVTAFTDGYPFLIISQEALEELNRRLETPLPMDRFRPNLVVAGAGPHAEDGWRRIRAGDVEIEVVNPCPRCAVTTVDQATGERGKEPLRTLATYRARDGKVVFGQNAIHRGRGTIAVGDPIEVLKPASAG